MIGIPKKGIQRAMRFLRWANEATQEELDAALKRPAPRVPKCYRCQGGRGLHLCGACAVAVKSIFRKWTRERRKARETQR